MPRADRKEKVPKGWYALKVGAKVRKGDRKRIWQNSGWVPIHWYGDLAMQKPVQTDEVIIRRRPKALSEKESG